MPILTALAISIGALGGIATWAFVGPLAGFGLQIWAAFVAWAAYYHSGGKAAALKSNLPAHIFGAFVGWAALFAITKLAGALGVPLAGGLCVGIGAAAIVLAANLPLLAGIPSSVYGFGCVAGFTLLAGKLELLTAASIVDNPFINIVVSMAIGALLAFASEKIGTALAAKPAAAGAPAA
ncbi:DUF1097 domain-containing protein [Oleomonas cavernae]|uniref:DUF1097 domain-containing protein n=1 Tax=Oleomonas cavernae TaxID=2320859 RepID=A0A418WCG5_9PROT|nr:DUF1097 domain-containing protein [Oleomonas cavernae]RJF87618.1 DUF1097 domain-containing protein [Oleomonas cavernae]